MAPGVKSFSPSEIPRVFGEDSSQLQAVGDEEVAFEHVDGFKLKFLDYIFGRVAVASLTHATAGLPEAIRSAMICRDDIGSLVQAIVAHIDDTDALSLMQDAALAAARARYRWEDRGHELLDAVRRHAALHRQPGRPLRIDAEATS